MKSSNIRTIQAHYPFANSNGSSMDYEITIIKDSVCSILSTTLCDLIELSGGSAGGDCPEDIYTLIRMRDGKHIYCKESVQDLQEWLNES
jgi:hypothetical protein